MCLRNSRRDVRFKTRCLFFCLTNSPKLQQLNLSMLRIKLSIHCYEYDSVTKVDTHPIYNTYFANNVCTQFTSYTSAVFHSGSQLPALDLQIFDKRYIPLRLLLSSPFQGISLTLGQQKNFTGRILRSNFRKYRETLRVCLPLSHKDTLFAFLFGFK